MESYAKTGKVFLQPHKAGKKWKPVLLSLFPASSSGVGRLEIQDMGGGGAGGDHGSGGRRHHQPLGDRKLKVVRLSQLISVLRLPPNAEACPTENMSAFCVEAQDRTMVFAAHKEDCVDWVEKLCHSAFPRGGGSGSDKLLMEENQIYASADEAASEFWVAVQRTDASTRCGLQGSHWLQVGRASLRLKDTKTKSVVREWPYELLRRYGKDKMALTIEAGRRCDSGPGTFTFETQQAEKIFALIQSTIKRKTQSHQTDTNQDGDKGPAPNIQAHSPLPKLPDVTVVPFALERERRTDESPRVPEETVAPITLMPLPLVPTHNSSSEGHRSDQSEPVYADPADCVLPASKPPPTALYVDPASILPLKAPGSRETPPTSSSSSSPSSSSAPQPGFDLDHPDSVYSEVYDKVSPVQSQRMRQYADDKRIYTEPVKEKAPDKSEKTPDQFAHLYAQVCKKAPSSSPTLSVTPPEDSTKEQSFDDVIYENLGVI